MNQGRKRGEESIDQRRGWRYPFARSKNDRRRQDEQPKVSQPYLPQASRNCRDFNHSCRKKRVLQSHLLLCAQKAIRTKPGYPRQSESSVLLIHKAHHQCAFLFRDLRASGPLQSKEKPLKLVFQRPVFDRVSSEMFWLLIH